MQNEIQKRIFGLWNISSEINIIKLRDFLRGNDKKQLNQEKQVRIADLLKVKLLSGSLLIYAG